MKKYIITIVGIILLVIIIGLYLISEKQYYRGPSSHIWFYCDNVDGSDYPFRFFIEKKNDGQMHFVIDGKYPPLKDIIVSKTVIPNGYEYVGNNIYVKDAPNNLEVNLNSKVLQNCRKVYPGV